MRTSSAAGREAGETLIKANAAALVLMASVALPLAAQNESVITGTVKNAVTGAPVADARVTVVPGNRSYVTRGDGSYHLTTASATAQVRVTAFGFAPVSQGVSVSAASSTVLNFELRPSAKQLDEVVTLGTRTHERTKTGSTAPVDVISSQLLEESGVIETWQQLERLVPSAFGAHIPIADNGLRPVTLRGLSPQHTLVLVNGKRRHPEAALFGSSPSIPNTEITDLSSIPASAIDHIEVLRDGASAQYGSDAIAGVINVVLKSGERRDLRTTFGQVYSTDGDRTFHDGSHFDADGTFGLTIQRGGYLTVAGEYRDRRGTNRAYPDRRQQYFTGDPRNNDPRRVSSYTGDGNLRSTSVFVTGASPLNAQMEVYGFGGVSYKDNFTRDAFFRRPQDTATVRALFPDGFLPIIQSGIGDASALAGVRGSVRALHWDLSSGLGASRVGYHVHNSNNTSLGAQSPTSFYAGRVAAQQWTSNLDLLRAFEIAFPLTLAGGAEVRLERYQIRAGDSASWIDGGVPVPDGPIAGAPAPAGAQGMPGIRPGDEATAHRSNAAIYLDAEAQPFKRLLVQSAARAERYSDFGSTSDGKVAARLELANGIAVRGSMSTGFRAPSLMEEYSASSRTVYKQTAGVGQFFTTRVFPVSSPEAKLLGAVKLRPETSVNRSAGIVLSKAWLPVITADYYDIKLDHRILLTGSVTDPSIVELFNENGMRGIAGGSYFTNFIATRTRGVDVVASHALRVTNSGVMRILGGYNYNRTRVTHVDDSPAPLAAFAAQLFNRQSRGIIEHGQPLQTISVSLDYNTGPLGLDVHNQRSGPTAMLDQRLKSAGGMDQQVNAKWVTDVRASYQLRPRVGVAISAANLFDVYPDRWLDFNDGVNAKGFSNHGMFRYPGAVSEAGQNGRTLYLQLEYR